MIKSPLETDIFNYHTPEFFINMKNIPDKASSERKAFVLEEKRKCKEGININGIHIPSSLYFHLNYYHLQRDATEKELLAGSDKKIVSLPNLRDNEWIVFNDYDQVCKNPKIYTLCGARQLIKTEFIVSLTLRELSLFKNTEALGIFQADEDKDTFVKKIRLAIEAGEKFIIVPNIDKSWEKKEIRFGITKQDNSLDLRGVLYLYNTQEGKKIQVSAGKTPTFFFSDEVAKNPFRTVYDVVEPALLSDTGKLRCTPIFTFTGGEAEKAVDAKNLVLYPDEKKQFTTVVENKVVGARVLFGHYRKDCKRYMKFSDYVGQKTDTWLDDYPILATDFDLADKTIDEDLAAAAKAPDSKTLLMKRIFFPRKLSDIFLMEGNNNFPTEHCLKQQEYLKEKYTPQYVSLVRTRENSIHVEESKISPIEKFPVNQADVKIAPLCIYERVILGLPLGVYVMGIDTVNEDTSSDKEVSLGSFYVYKRMYDPFGEFQNQMVCSFAGRFSSLKDFHELCLATAEYYNALVLPENEEKTLIQYFINKKKDYLLFPAFDLAKRINPLTKTNRTYGLSASTPNQKYGMSLIVEDSKDMYQIDDENEEMGVYKILDPMLLEEMIQYRGKPQGSKGVHDINVDRICAWYHTLILAKHLDNAMPLGNIKLNKKQTKEEERSRDILISPFLTTIKQGFSPSKGKGNSPFLTVR